MIIVSITDDREKSLSLGAMDFLQKPVKKDRLFSTLPEYAVCSEGGFKTVLIMDDNPADVELIRSIFKTRGCQVLDAGDGAEGFETALREKPDLIILDLNMPQYIGLGFSALPERTGRGLASAHTGIHRSGAVSRRTQAAVRHGAGCGIKRWWQGRPVVRIGTV